MTVWFISLFYVPTKTSLQMKRSIWQRRCVTKIRFTATTAQITWYMQRIYQSDIQREKNAAEEYHLLWSLSDCSFHISSHDHLRTCRMLNAGRWRLPKIKNRCGDGAHHQEAHHFLMNGCPSVSPCPAFCKSDTLRGNLRREAEVTPVISPTSSSAGPLHNLLSQTCAEASGVTGGSV